MARGRRGQSLVEMAVAFPVVLLLVAGALDLAHLFSVAGILANAAREGARVAASHGTSDDIKNRVVEEAAGAPLTLDPSEVFITYNPDNNPGNSVSVQVNHAVDLLITQGLGLPSPTLRRQATMVLF
jgi:Flp pilus assembly protein TadG